MLTWGQLYGTVVYMKMSEYNKIIKVKSKQNKLRAIRTEYKGFVYDSKKEAAHAMVLDSLSASKNDDMRVIKWERQLPYRFEVDGQLICKYILDFKVWYADGRIEHVDVKGMKKGNAYSMFRLKKKMMKIFHDIDVIEV